MNPVTLAAFRDELVQIKEAGLFSNFIGGVSKAAPAATKAVGALGTATQAAKKLPLPKGALTNPNDLMAGFTGAVQRAAPRAAPAISRVPSNAQQGILRSQGWVG